jgi:hypothetical protein
MASDSTFSNEIHVAPHPIRRPESPLRGRHVVPRPLPEGPIPNFDWKALPPAVPPMKIDVPRRIEKLQKYLNENKYPRQQKNIIAAIEMYNRKELPKLDKRIGHIQAGKLTELNDCIERAEPPWAEVRFNTICIHGYVYLIHTVTSGLPFSVHAGGWLSASNSAIIHCRPVQSHRRWC